MIAGIVLAAFGLEETLAHVALRLRNARTLNVERLAVAVLLFALIVPATQVDALVAILGVNVLVWAMIVYETVHVYDEGRYRLRHGVEFQLPEDRNKQT